MLGASCSAIGAAGVAAAALLAVAVGAPLERRLELPELGLEQPCAGQPDGPAFLPGWGCRGLLLCAGGRPAGLRLCAEGSLFDGRSCVPADGGGGADPRCTHRPAKANACAGKSDGPHADPAAGPDCRSYLLCAAGQAEGRSLCPPGLLWNGTACADAASWTCEPPQPWPGCAALPPGLHADRSAPGCGRGYLHCAAGNRTRLSCPPGLAFDGQQCAPANEACGWGTAGPALRPGSCAGRPDGYSAEPGSGCRSYYLCAAGHKITFVCPAGREWDGRTCRAAGAVRCIQPAAPGCAGRPDGYRADPAAGCRSYFYCLGGTRVVTLTCPPGHAFDGRRCAARAGCGPGPGSPAPSSGSASGSRAGAECPADGFYRLAGSRCRSYYFCIGGRKTPLACPPSSLFDGQLCVDERSYSCPDRPDPDLDPATEPEPDPEPSPPPTQDDVSTPLPTLAV